MQKEALSSKSINMRTRRIIIVLLWLAFIALCLLIYFSNPTKNILYLCPSTVLFGIYCPTCGMTRGVYSLMRFEFIDAFFYNQFLTLTFLFWLYLIISSSVNAFFAKKIMPIIRFKLYWIIPMVVIFLLLGFLRNFEAFSFLAPKL